MADNIQHGIDDNPNNDAEKGAALGGLGGVAVGAAAGAVAGPLGAVVGAIAGGLMGAGASGLAVGAVNEADNDNTVSGFGTSNRNASGDIRASSNAPVIGDDISRHNVVTGNTAISEAGNTGLAGGALVGGTIGAAVGGPVGAVVGGTLGSLAGGVAGDATEAVDDIAAANNYSGDAFRANAAVSPNPVLSNTPMTDYRGVDTGLTSVGATDQNADMATMGDLGVPGVRMGESVPGVETGSVNTVGENTNYTRGTSADMADGMVGDDRDDKIDGTVLNDPAR